MAFFINNKTKLVANTLLLISSLALAGVSVADTTTSSTTSDALPALKFNTSNTTTGASKTATTTATTPAAPASTATATTPATTSATTSNSTSTATTTAKPTTSLKAPAKTMPTTTTTDSSKAGTATKAATIAMPKPMATDSSDTKVINFANTVALAVFTYDYKNYKTNLQKAEKYFTVDGWKSFNKALTDSKNINAVTQAKLAVTAKVSGDAKVLKHSTTGTTQTWQVQVPLQVIYQSADKSIKQELMVKLAINSDVSGFVVNQIIAMPDTSKS